MTEVAMSEMERGVDQQPMMTPRALGYRMPAEWEPHEATWLAWPHNPEDWPGKFQPIPWVYAEIVGHLARVEDVHILVDDAATEKRARGVLKKTGANLRRRALSFVADGSRVDAGFRADFCVQGPAGGTEERGCGPDAHAHRICTGGCYKLEVQCLGEVSGLAP